MLDNDTSKVDTVRASVRGFRPRLVPSGESVEKVGEIKPNLLVDLRKDVVGLEQSAFNVRTEPKFGRLADALIARICYGAEEEAARRLLDQE